MTMMVKFSGWLLSFRRCELVGCKPVFDDKLPTCVSDLFFVCCYSPRTFFNYVQLLSIALEHAMLENVFEVHQLNPEQEDHKGPMDVVMLCKEWVHSASLSQQPLVILPESYIKVLERSQLTTLGRKELSKKECEEFLGSYFLTSK